MITATSASVFCHPQLASASAGLLQDGGQLTKSEKGLCAGVSMPRKKEICPHSLSVGSSFCLIVRNVSHVHSCSVANERVTVATAGFSNQDSRLLHQQSGMFAARATGWRKVELEKVMLVSEVGNMVVCP